MLISANVRILLLLSAFCWVLDMCVISVNNNTLRPSSAVLSSISDCVLTVSHHQQSQKRSKTRRGHRAGRGSCRTISSVIGNWSHDVHSHQTQSPQCHLVFSLQKVTLRNCSGTGTNLRVGSVNTQSVRNKVDELTNIIIHKDLDVLALCEHWLTTRDKDRFYVNALSLPGYKFHFFSRLKGYGGVALLLRSSIRVKSTRQFASEYFENCILTLCVDSKCLDICVLYSPPASEKNDVTTTRFITEFSSLLDEYVTNTVSVIFVGDINVHLEKPLDSSTRAFNDLLQSLNFTQHVPPETPTHQSGSTLNCVISRSDERLISKVSVDELVSDHNLIQFTASFSKPQKPTRTIVKWNWREIDIPTFTADLRRS